MKKKILVLNGSPREKGNSHYLSEAFINGAENAGHDIIRYNVIDSHISACKACDSCFKNGNACTFDEDFSNFADIALEADALVIASPLYWFTFSSQVKLILDKFYSFHISKKELKIKEVLLMACGGTDNTEMFSGMIDSYKKIAAFQNWKDKGALIVTNVHDKGDIIGNIALKDSEKLGFEF